MPHSYKILSLGVEAVSLEFDVDVIDPTLHQRLLGMKMWFELNPITGLRDVVLGYRSLTITYALHQLVKSNGIKSGFEFVKGKLELAYQQSTQYGRDVASRKIRVPVCYHPEFGFDRDEVCKRNMITTEELIQLHTAIEYTVYLIGFLPGFPYMGFVDPRLEVPRHPVPRQNVPAGSVGVAGKQTGIYPFDSPGGWQIIGRTPLKLFNASNTPPVIFEPGDIITFYSITESEFQQIQMSES